MRSHRFKSTKSASLSASSHRGHGDGSEKPPPPPTNGASDRKSAPPVLNGETAPLCVEEDRIEKGAGGDSLNFSEDELFTILKKETEATSIPTESRTGSSSPTEVVINASPAETENFKPPEESREEPEDGSIPTNASPSSLSCASAGAEATAAAAAESIHSSPRESCLSISFPNDSLPAADLSCSPISEAADLCRTTVSSPELCKDSSAPPEPSLPIATVAHSAKSPSDDPPPTTAPQDSLPPPVVVDQLEAPPIDILPSKSPTPPSPRPAFPVPDEVTVEEMTSRDFYLDSSAHFSFHEESLKDLFKSSIFYEAIFANKEMFRGKVVLNVRAGTGLLSMWAAIAGASIVVAVDNSNVIDYTKKIFEKNFEGRNDVVLFAVKGNIREIQLPYDLHQVDIIISEWMGTCLFYDTVIGDVIFARDKWLRRGGLILPDRANLYVVAVQNSEYLRSLEWWDHVYGFDMSYVKSWVMQEPIVCEVKEANLVSNPCLIREIDLYKLKSLKSISFETYYVVNVNKKDNCNGLVLYFNVDFTKLKKRVSFSTHPKSELKSWKQTMLLLNETLCVSPGDIIEGMFRLDIQGRKRIALDFGLHLQGAVMKRVEKANFVLQ